MVCIGSERFKIAGKKALSHFTVWPGLKSGQNNMLGQSFDRAFYDVPLLHIRIFTWKSEIIVFAICCFDACNVSHISISHILVKTV